MTERSNFLYQAAQDAAKYGRKVFNRYYKREKTVVGEAIEPQARIKIELGYVRKWKVEGVERQEFHTSKHLNMALEAYVAKRLEEVAEQIVVDLEAKALEMTMASRDAVAAELAAIDALHREQGYTGPEAA